MADEGFLAAMHIKSLEVFVREGQQGYVSGVSAIRPSPASLRRKSARMSFAGLLVCRNSLAPFASPRQAGFSLFGSAFPVRDKSSHGEHGGPKRYREDRGDLYYGGDYGGSIQFLRPGVNERAKNQAVDADQAQNNHLGQEVGVAAIL